MALIPSTLRGRLVLALGLVLLTVLTLAALLVWGSRQADLYLRRGQLAEAQLAAYLRLALEARQPPGRSLEPLFRTLEDLTRQELALTLDPAEAAREREELAQLATLRRLAARLDDPGPGPHAAFRQAIDAALSDEQAEVTAVTERSRALSRRLAGAASLTAGAALALTTLIGLGLWRSVRQPLDALLAGTQQLAAGALDHRLEPTGPAECVGLAEGFNRMGETLERQHRALLAARADLERTVAERTRELHTANRELQRLDRSRRRLFADLSHELRTPLTVIRGEAEVTLRGPDKPAADYRAALARIAELGAQMGRLLDDLLLLARSDIPGERTDVQTLPLDGLLESVRAQADALARSRGLSLNLTPADCRLWVRGDPRALSRLLLSLIDNACRYTPAGGEVTLSLERDGAQAVLSVSDTGIGIEAPDLGRVWERHYRGRRARALAPEGSGLGLPLARSIARAHHGSLDLASTPEAGTTVTLRLPLADPEALPHAAAAG